MVSLQRHVYLVAYCQKSRSEGVRPCEKGRRGRRGVTGAVGFDYFHPLDLMNEV